MNEEERIKAMQYEIERKIEEVKEKHSTFVIYLPYAIIVADNYKFEDVLKDHMDLYINNIYIGTIIIWYIVDIE
jgi:hypothetical protein